MIFSDQPIGEVIAQLRTDFGMTRSDVTRNCGIMERTIGRIENGEHARPDWETIKTIITKGFGLHLELTFRPPDKGDKEEP